MKIILTLIFIITVMILIQFGDQVITDSVATKPFLKSSMFNKISKTKLQWAMHLPDTVYKWH